MIPTRTAAIGADVSTVGRSGSVCDRSQGSSIADHTFTGLYSDKRYWFRVVAIGRKGQQAYSPVISRSIQ